MDSIAASAASRALDRHSFSPYTSSDPPSRLPWAHQQSLVSCPPRRACFRRRGVRCAGTSANGAAPSPLNGPALGIPEGHKGPPNRSPERPSPEAPEAAKGNPSVPGRGARGSSQEPPGKGPCPLHASSGAPLALPRPHSGGGTCPAGLPTPLSLAQNPSAAPSRVAAGASAKGAAAAAAPSPSAVPCASAAPAAAVSLPCTRRLTVHPPRDASGEAAEKTIPVDAMRVAYMGAPGAFGEVAASRAYPCSVPVPFPHFETAFQAVEQWLVERAVLPIENSLGGSIHRNYDLLLRHRLHIVGEVQLPVTHCLLALPGSSISGLTKVMSHPQALSQCEVTLFRLGIATREAVDSTAGAAKMVAEGRLQGVAAIASSRAAELYGLEILAEGIQDGCDNVTRFMALARDPIVPRVGARAPTKTSIVFALAKGPGGLFKALSVFALRDLNLTKVESRPRRDRPLLSHLLFEEWQRAESKMSSLDCATASPTLLIHGIHTGHEHYGTEVGEDTRMGSNVQMFDYIFYADIQASLADTRLQNALRHLKEFAPFIRVLGSYSMDTGSSSL